MKKKTKQDDLEKRRKESNAQLIRQRKEMEKIGYKDYDYYLSEKSVDKAKAKLIKEGHGAKKRKSTFLDGKPYWRLYVKYNFKKN